MTEFKLHGLVDCRVVVFISHGLPTIRFYPTSLVTWKVRSSIRCSMVIFKVQVVQPWSELHRPELSLRICFSNRFQVQIQGEVTVNKLGAGP